MKVMASAVSGFSLIEVTLAAAIFSMGLSGLSLFLLTAVTGTAEAGHQTMATTKAGSLAELITLNSEALGHYVNPLPEVAEACVELGDCSREQLASLELGAWQRDLSEELPGGRGLVCRDSTPDDGDADDDACDGAGGLVVKVFWQEMHNPNDELGGFRRLVARLSF